MGSSEAPKTVKKAKKAPNFLRGTDGAFFIICFSIAGILITYGVGAGQGWWPWS